MVLFQRGTRRQEIAPLLEALVQKHPTGTISVAWDNADTHEDDEVEAVVRAAAGRLVLLYLPTYSRLSPSHRDAVAAFSPGSHEIRAFFETKPALLAAAQQCFERFNQCPEQILSVIGSKAKKVA